MSKSERKAVIKRSIITNSIITLGSVCFAFGSIAVRASDAYGVQNLVTPSKGVAPAPPLPQNNQQNQQAVMDSLLAKARAENAAGGQVNGAQGGGSFGSSPSSQPSRAVAATPTGNAGLSEQAFADAVRNSVPLSPEQIKTLHYLFDQSQRAASAYPGVPPKPTSTSVIVNLSPGATPPVVRLSSGFVTSLVFLDSTGAPWPINAIDMGNPKSFNVEWNKKGNTLLVQALDHYQSGNLAVMLKGLDTPVMLTLLPGQNAVDYRVDLRVPGIGPEANPVLDGLPATQSPQLLTVLNGIPPNGSKPLTITGGDCQGWLLNGHLFLRTRLTILSPGWISTMSSGDGTHAYELQSTPVVLASSRGKLVKLMIEGL